MLIDNWSTNSGVVVKVWVMPGRWGSDGEDKIVLDVEVYEGESWKCIERRMKVYPVSVDLLKEVYKSRGRELIIKYVQSGVLEVLGAAWEPLVEEIADKIVDRLVLKERSDV